MLAVALTLLFARGEAVAGVVPGPEAVDRFRGLLDSAMAITREQRPPVESSQGIVLLVVASIGLVAIAVDLLAASVRQPALAGLPLLAVYCVPAALLPGGLPWYYFVAAAAGFLLLLSADAGDRIRAWGRVLSAPTPSGVLGRPSSADGGFARGGRRVGVVAILVAALVPAMVPGLGDRLLNDAGGNGTGPGDGNTIRTLNPILQLRQNLTSSDDHAADHVPDRRPGPRAAADRDRGRLRRQGVGTGPGQHPAGQPGAGRAAGGARPDLAGGGAAGVHDGSTSGTSRSRTCRCRTRPGRSTSPAGGCTTPRR